MFKSESLHWLATFKCFNYCPGWFIVMMKGHAVSDSLKGRQKQPFTVKDVCVCGDVDILSYFKRVYFNDIDKFYDFINGCIFECNH